MTLQQSINNEILGKVIAETLVSIHAEYENNRLSENSYKRWIKPLERQPSSLKTTLF